MIIVPCKNPDSDGWRAVVAHTIVAMFGRREDGPMCSKLNVSKSCFAAEWCDRGLVPPSPHTFVTDLMLKHRCYAALDNRPGLPRVMLGFVAVSNDNYLSSFCVTEPARGSGVGRDLLKYVLARHGSRTMRLTVAAPIRPETAAGSVLGERHDRLVAFYEKNGFSVSEPPRDGYTHMSRPPGGSSSDRRSGRTNLSLPSNVTKRVS